MMTRDLWPSSFVAALFAIHPLHVQSVAWLAERKDLVCTFFGFLAIWSYIRYAHYPRIDRYLPVFLFFYPGSYGKADDCHFAICIVVAGLLVTTTTLLALRFVKSRPWFIVGWLWFLGTLIPVIGLVQVGAQSMADRYTYVPLIGIFIIISWGLSDIKQSPII